MEEMPFRYDLQILFAPSSQNQISIGKLIINLIKINIKSIKNKINFVLKNTFI